MIQVDSFGQKVITIIRYGEPETVYLHVDENEERYMLSFSRYHASSKRVCTWCYYKDEYKTLDEAVSQYIEELCEYFLV